jgi:hypothetical protein
LSERHATKTALKGCSGTRLAEPRRSCRTSSAVGPDQHRVIAGGGAAVEGGFSTFAVTEANVLTPSK